MLNILVFAIPTLRSYFAAVNYYGKFMHEVRKPMNQLLKLSKWEWTEECQQSFKKFKKNLQSVFFLLILTPS